MKIKNIKPTTTKELKQMGKNAVDKLHQIKCQGKKG